MNVSVLGTKAELQGKKEINVNKENVRLKRTSRWSVARPVECRKPDRGWELAQNTDTIPEEREQKRIIRLLNLLVSDDFGAAVE